MKCDEFKELAAAYALDVLDESEHQACAAHLAEAGPHAGCAELVSRYERTLALLGASIGERPAPISVWHAIQARLGTRTRTERSWPVAVAWAAAACALVFGLWSRQLSEQHALEARRNHDQSATAIAERDRALTSRAACLSTLETLQDRDAVARAALALLERKDTRLIAMNATDTRSFHAASLYAPDLRRAFVISTSLVAVAEKDFELWVIHPGQNPKPAGLLRFDEAGVAIGEFDAQLLAEAPAAFAISLEPKGGSPAPTDVVMLGSVGG